ncbi:MAG TPA: primase-helicase family protein [Devosia sp.]|jgi:hypothetical protein|uniref:primase-helicase family protein n=1 Tax=Devosia sp. TaxID=1871048 RepID=UPI002DDD439C|nr:primase-helicase family protein [Devosia sp.]HEV2517150.1 primase-helicase family protein [Devosia sp.]
MTPPDDDIAEAAKRFEEELRSKREQQQRDTLDAWIWASEPTAFVRRSDHKIWNEKQWGSHYAHLNPKGSISSLALRKGLVEKFETLVYEPGGEQVIGTGFNLWKPAGLTPVEGDVQWFIDHVHYLFPGDDQAAELVLDYMALLVTPPWPKILFALLIHSLVHGTGKSLLAWMLTRMLGDSNVVNPSNDEMSTSQFTQWQEGKQLAVVNELMMQDRLAAANRLKTLITEPTLRIRALYRSPYEVPNRLNVFTTSNHPDAAKLENEDRRWLVVESKVTASDKRPPEYYVDIVRRIRDDAEMGAVLWYLQHREVKLNPYGAAPVTQAKVAMQERAIPDEEAYLLQLHEEGAWPFDFDLVRKDDLVTAVLHRFPGHPKGIIGRIDVLLRDRLGAVKQERTTNLGKGRKSWQLWSVRKHDEWAKAGQTRRMDAYMQHQERRARSVAMELDYREEPA